MDNLRCPIAVTSALQNYDWTLCCDQSGLQVPRLAQYSAGYDDMLEQQLDLFSANGFTVEQTFPECRAFFPAVEGLEDEVLIAAIPTANLDDYAALVAEAGRRRLTAAIPGLVALCRRFAGFGIDHMVTEQSAALRALAAIGGRDAAQAVSLLIVRGVVQGPTLGLAVAVAAQLRNCTPYYRPMSCGLSFDTQIPTSAPMHVALLADSRNSSR